MLPIQASLRSASKFEETARKYALEIHAEGQKTKNEQLYNVAKSLYEKYLEFFPHTNQTAQIRFYLAEILYKQNQYIPAADNYLSSTRIPRRATFVTTRSTIPQRLGPPAQQRTKTAGT